MGSRCYSGAVKPYVIKKLKPETEMKGDGWNVISALQPTYL